MFELFFGLVKTRRGRAILSFLLTFLGALWSYIGWTESKWATLLSQSQSFADARITAVKHDAPSLPYVYVQYRFEVPGRAAPLENKEVIDLAGSWAKIPAQEWDEVERTHHVRVAYLQNDPEVNLPFSGLALEESNGRWTLRLGIVTVLIGGLGVAWRIAKLFPLEPALVPREAQTLPRLIARVGNNYKSNIPPHSRKN